MAYPTIPAPYGFKPVSLIGGQFYAASTRQLPIQYNFGTNIYFGDMVAITRGYVTRVTMTTGASATTGGAGYGQVGIFVGCTFTDPVSKQKRFSQYWPANTLAGDAFAYVTDDPDVLFKAVATTSTTSITVGSISTPMIGLNFYGSDYSGSTAAVGGNINTGDSYNGIAVASTPSYATTSTFPFRLVDLVRDTATATTATLTSGGGGTSLVTSALPAALPIGTEVGYLAANGQYIGTGSFVATAAAAGATAVTINAQAATVSSPAGTSSTGITIPANSTLVFTQYPEGLFKMNFGLNSYYNATGTQTA